MQSERWLLIARPYFACVISWATVPALRLALAFACGVVAVALTPATDHAPALIGGCLVTAALLFWPTSLVQRTRVRGLGVLCATCLVGALVGLRNPNATAYSTPLPESTTGYVVKLEQAPQRQGGWLRADGRVLRLYADSTWRDTSFRARLMLDTAYADSLLGRGAILVGRSELAEPKSPLNPHTFDFRSYLRDQGIGLQTWIRPAQARVLSPASPPTFVERIRSSVAERIVAAFPRSPEAGVAIALLLGDKSALDETTRNDYVQAGAVHVLAVSGLHTGIVAAIITFLLRGLGKRARPLQILLLWIGLGAYVALTGYAPSVQRAAVMFGILFAGRLARLDSNGFNSLGLSAILLLLVNPNFIFELGFQLSYLAVGGILAFYPTLSRILRSPLRPVNWLGQSVAIGLAATLATAPLTVYYFHQFPIYFAVSGSFAVPLVGAALWFLLAGLSAQALLAIFGLNAAWALLPGYACVWIMNRGLAQVTALPSALVQGLWPSALTCALALACVALAGAATLRRRFAPALAAGFCFVACSGSYVFDSFQKSGFSEVITYSLRSGQLTDVIAAGQVVTLSQKPVSDAELARSILPHRSAYNLVSAKTASLVDSLSTRIPGLVAYSALGRVWLVLPDRAHGYADSGPPVDFAIVQETRKTEPSTLAKAFRKTPLVLTQRPPPWRRAAWSDSGLRIHELRSSGSYTIKTSSN